MTIKSKSGIEVVKTEPEKKDIFQEVTDSILEALEKGVSPWHKPWETYGCNGFPVNAGSSREYSGINVLLLWLACQRNGYTVNRWLTFDQIRKLGGKVTKGERATTTVVYRPREVVKTNRDGEIVYDADGNEIMVNVPFISRNKVFNVCQCENLPDEVALIPDLPELPEIECIENADRLIQASQIQILYKRQNRAYYSPGFDHIMMPLKGQFKAAADYYSTVLHELVHSTGHASRLNREGITSGKSKKGNKVYAFEELVAEIGSAFLYTSLGIKGEVQHASYVDHWIKVLREDKKAIFKASSLARKAFEYLYANLEETKLAA